MITDKDITGSILGFPIEIVERMLFHQEYQNNKRNIEVFQYKRDSSKRVGGFDWKNTQMFKEGIAFWSNILNHKDFTQFFALYPKVINEVVEQVSPIVEASEPIIITKPEFNLGDIVIVTNNGNINKSKKERIYIGSVENSNFPHLAVTKEAMVKLMAGQCSDISSYALIKKVEESAKIVELTLEDISQGKGVGIDPSLIKIVKSKK